MKNLWSISFIITALFMFGCNQDRGTIITTDSKYQGKTSTEGENQEQDQEGEAEVLVLQPTSIPDKASVQEPQAPIEIEMVHNKVQSVTEVCIEQYQENQGVPAREREVEFQNCLAVAPSTAMEELGIHPGRVLVKINIRGGNTDLFQEIEDLSLNSEIGAKGIIPLWTSDGLDQSILFHTGMTVIVQLSEFIADEANFAFGNTANAGLTYRFSIGAGYLGISVDYGLVANLNEGGGMHSQGTVGVDFGDETHYVSISYSHPVDDSSNSDEWMTLSDYQEQYTSGKVSVLYQIAISQMLSLRSRLGVTFLDRDFSLLEEGATMSYGVGVDINLNCKSKVYVDAKVSNEDAFDNVIDFDDVSVEVGYRHTLEQKDCDKKRPNVHREFKR